MPLNKRALCQLGAIILVCLLASACSPASPVPTPTPSTPRPSRTQATETQIERDMRLDFEAAEKAYRRFRAEYDRVAAAGGTDRATDVMSANASGPYLKVMTSFLSQTKRASKRQRGEVRITYVHFGAYKTTDVDLMACEDGTKVTNVNSSGKVLSRGIALNLSLTLRLVNGNWKVWDGDDKQVKSRDD